MMQTCQALEHSHGIKITWPRADSEELSKNSPSAIVQLATVAQRPALLGGPGHLLSAD